MTYIQSTDIARESYRVTSGKDIVCGIHVPVMFSSTSWLGTLPLANAERKTFNDEPTSGARFATGKEAVDLEQSAPVPGTLVLQERDQHPPRSVRNNASETVVFEHPRHIQILDNDHLIFANESSRKLVEMVSPSIGNTGVKPSKLLSCLVPVSGSFLFAGKPTRKYAFATCLSLIVPRIGDFLPSGERSKGGNPNVNANSRLELRKGNDALVLAKKRDVPASGGIETDCHGRRLCPNREGRLHLIFNGASIFASVNALFSK